VADKIVYVSYLGDSCRDFTIVDGQISKEDYEFLQSNCINDNDHHRPVEPTTSQFYMYTTIQNDGHIVVWCKTASENETLTIKSVVQRESCAEGDGATNPCLTGDTLITMADGS
jgi:hypothetical protein